MFKDREIEEYLDQVCSRVKFARAHRGLKKEIRYHIDDQRNDYIKSGLNKEDATIKAIKEMGDPIVVGDDLNKIHKPQTDWITIGLITLLMTFGLIILVSLKNDNVLKIHEIKNHIKYMVLGSILILGLYFFDYSKLEKYSNIAYGLGMLIMGFTIQTHIVIRGVRYSPYAFLSFLSAILFIIGFSGVVERQHKADIKELIKTLVLAGIPLVLYMVGIRKYIIAISLGAAFLLLMINAISKGKYGKDKKKNYILLGGTVTVICACGIVLMNLSHMVGSKIRAFLPGYGDPRGDGWIYYIIRKQLSGSKAFGPNVVEADYNILETLPDLKFDYILTYIIASLGWIVGFIIIGLSVFMILRLIKMTGKLRNKFGKNIAISIIILLSVELVIVVLGNLALIPSILSYGLPFISLGGGALLGNMIIVGLLLSIWRTNNIILDPKGKREIIKE